jgi:putative oxidoreductase
MSKLKSFFNQPDFGLLIYRIFIGLSIAFAHGLSKLPPSEQMLQGVESMGFPLPVLFAWAAALSEFVGGLLIAAGLFTRHASVFLGFTMAVAAFKVHADDPFKVKELALLYLVSCVLFIFAGAGQYSIDKLFRKK